MRVLARLRPAELVVLATIDVVRDTPPDCHFSAWSRPKPAPDPPLGPSVASGVIPTKSGRNEALQPPAGRALQGRWRSSPWKRCNHAPPRSRGQGAPRTARCIKTIIHTMERAETIVREHPAPLGALRPLFILFCSSEGGGQGAPRTARCIKTALSCLSSDVRKCQGAPRTARCIKTAHWKTLAAKLGQGVPRTARCIKTLLGKKVVVTQVGQGAPRTARCIKTATMY